MDYGIPSKIKLTLTLGKEVNKMKFNKIFAGYYRSEDGRYEVQKHYGEWEAYSLELEEPVYRAGKIVSYKNKYLGHRATLKEAKELCK